MSNMYWACGEDIFIFGKYTISFCVKKAFFIPYGTRKTFLLCKNSFLFMLYTSMEVLKNRMISVRNDPFRK